MEFQYETVLYCIEAYPLLFIVLKYFWPHSKHAPLRDQTLKGILTPGKRVQQASFNTWNIDVKYMK